MKQIYVSGINPGDKIEKQDFLVKTVKPPQNNEVEMVLGDKTGDIRAYMHQELAEKMQLQEKAVITVTGVVRIQNTIKELRIVHAESCKNVIPAVLYQGISPETAQEHKDAIRRTIKKITHPGYKALVEACLSEQNLNTLASLPATFNRHGKYRGGALVATRVVTRMTESAMASYVNSPNGITTTPPNWSLLITAGLLHTFGRIEYCSSENPFERSLNGLEMNYYSMLQHSLEKIVFSQGVPILEQDFARLLNVLDVTVSDRTGTKATTKDGAILRAVYRLYSECEAMDWADANAEVEEEKEFYYSKELNRYLRKGANDYDFD